MGEDRLAQIKGHVRIVGPVAQSDLAGAHARIRHELQGRAEAVPAGVCEQGRAGAIGDVGDLGLGFHRLLLRGLAPKHVPRLGNRREHPAVVPVFGAAGRAALRPRECRPEHPFQHRDQVLPARDKLDRAQAQRASAVFRLEAATREDDHRRGGGAVRPPLGQATQQLLAVRTSVAVQTVAPVRDHEIEGRLAGQARPRIFQRSAPRPGAR